MDIGRKVIYAGFVQGVGFRYRATRIARQYNVTGYIQNLPDGSVELYAEGNSADVKGFLERIGEAMGQHIRNAQVTSVEPNGQYDSFGIRY